MGDSEPSYRPAQRFWDPKRRRQDRASTSKSSTPIDDGAAPYSQPARPRPQSIPYEELKQITDNFSDDRIVGHGGFGVVYKGVMPNGEIITVKMIVSSFMPGLQKQFESEVYHLMMLQHPNIVRCVGYCYEIRYACLPYDGKYVFAETAERLLCLEYMPKGSLDKYLSDKSSRHDWGTRYSIIKGICYGLCQLHEEIDKPIVHLDLKPANILLDDVMTPKITDFGLSRLLDQQQTICTSSRDGTFGYMAPEFLHGGTITPKSDIFSLGVIILEVVTGHRDYPDITTTPPDDFIEFTLEKWRNVLQRSLEDVLLDSYHLQMKRIILKVSTRHRHYLDVATTPKDEFIELRFPGHVSLQTDCEQIKRCIQVGIICVNPDRSKRPQIKKVIRMLQGTESIDYDLSNKAMQSTRQLTCCDG